MTDCDPVFDDQLAEQLGLDVDALRGHGATVVLASSPDVAVSPTSRTTRPPAGTRRTRGSAHDHPGTLQIDLHGFFVDEAAAHPDERSAARLRAPQRGRRLAPVSAWMLPAVDEALRTVPAGEDGRAGAPDRIA